MRKALHTLLAVASLSVNGQVMVDKPLVLDGPAPEQRQVTGLFPGTAPDRPLTATVEQSGAHRTSTAGGSSDWQVQLSTLTGPPGPGTHIVVNTPASPGSGPVQLTVNSDGPYAVLFTPGTSFLAEEASAQPVLSLVFDGAAFQVMNGRARQRRTCPTDMATVNDQYCIDLVQMDSTDYFVAGRECISQDKRLCSWGEWYGACNLATTLGLQNMTDGWEWTKDTANENNGARIVGPSCTSAGTWNVYNGPQRYRCCATR